MSSTYDRTNTPSPDSGADHKRPDLNNKNSYPGGPETPAYELPGAKTAASSEAEGDELEQEQGVSRIEALYAVFGKGWKLYSLWISIMVMYYAYSLMGNTVYVYQQFATSSFSAHASIGTIAVLTSILSGVAQPFIAKIADITSRPIALTAGMVFLCLGFIITASSSTVEAVCAGLVLGSIGQTIVQFIMGLIVADITPLKYRGLASGITSAPYIVNAFVSSYISTGISANTGGWRWGYGMFIIILPVCVAPILFILFWADRKAMRLGAVSIAASDRKAHAQARGLSYSQGTLALSLHYWRRMDGFGLLLMGTAFTLILLPFSLAAGADKGYKNPSLIAMFVVGGVLMASFAVWEWKFCAYPLMPKRVLNRSVIASIIIDFLYYLSGYVSGGYFNSWVYVIKDWSYTNYNFYINTLGVALCLFSILGGWLQKITHSYKYIQFSGLCIRIIGMALQFYASNGNPSDVVLIMAPILVGLGGSFSVIGSQVATQGSVPHRDMGIAMALLALWTSVGGGIGNAISAAVWTETLPKKLNEHVGGILNSTEIAEIYGSIVVAHLAEPKTEIRQAYNETMWYLNLAALALSFPPLIAGLMTSNFRLDDRHNSVEDKEVRFRDEDSILKEPVHASRA